MAKTATSFTKATAPRAGGTKHRRTRLKEALSMNNWEDLAAYVENEGAQKYIAALRGLKGRDYISAYTTILEYFRPKLQRSTNNAEDPRPAPIVWHEVKNYGPMVVPPPDIPTASGG